MSGVFSSIHNRFFPIFNRSLAANIFALYPLFLMTPFLLVIQTRHPDHLHKKHMGGLAVKVPQSGATN